jgi:large subunit ribosomal protein L4
MELPVIDVKGKSTSRKVSLNDAIYGIEPNDHAIYLDVKAHLANKRQGTAKNKSRSEVTGSTRKIRKQKGGGGARFGDIKSPLLKGGGSIFGPEPRDHSQKVNRKTKALARKSALAYKAKENAITVVEDLKLGAPKTKEFNAILANLKVGDKKTLLVLGDYDKNLYLSSRNLKGAEVITVSELNTYKILNAKTLLLSESSINVIEKTLS